MLNEDTNNVSTRLRALRKGKNLSRREFCDVFNAWKDAHEHDALPFLVERTYKSWETGEHSVNMDYLAAFCQFYETDMSYFFDDKRIIKEKIVEDISKYIGLNEEAVKKLHSSTKHIGGPLCARDQIISSGVFDLISLYVERVNIISQALNAWVNARPSFDTKEDKKANKMTMQLKLLELKETRKKIQDVFDGFLDDVSSYKNTEEEVAAYIEKLTEEIDLLEDKQSVSLDDIYESIFDEQERTLQ